MPSPCLENGQTPAPAPVATPAVSDAATAAAAEKPKTRLLKDVEAEENARIYKALYQSLDNAEEKSIKNDFSMTSDLLADSRKAKAEFFRATSLPMSEKAKGCSTLMRRLGQAENKQVASIFFTVTVMMFTLPVMAVFAGMRLIAPVLQLDPALCGGISGLLTAVTVMVGYTIYALLEDAARVRKEQNQLASQETCAAAASKKSD